MDLHGVVRGAIVAINPDISITIKSSTGYTVDPTQGYAQVPSYSTLTVMGQVQALTFMDLKQLDGTNQNGERRAVYLFGVSHGVVRSLQKGGDLLQWLDEDETSSTWLVNQVLEQWSDWVKVAVTRQNET